MMYPLSKEDKKLRNKVECVALGCYSVGLILFALTKCPISIMTTALAFPICTSNFGKKFLNK